MNKTKERSKNIKLRWGETKILKGGGGGGGVGGGEHKMGGWNPLTNYELYTDRDLIC